MDEVIPNLWIGDLASSLNVELLKENKIYSILSAMRGRVTLHDAFIRHQINIDDTDEEDVLVHFLPSIAFIQAELDKDRGVLVHCQAGMSRSATIVAAYLMYSRQIDCETALELIRKARPSIQPNDGFMLQLQIFHQAAFQISPRDKTTRMFYLERTLGEVMNGDGTISGTEMFAKFPRTPTESTPPTPGAPRRRIRCKMCRQELATREHMLDHGQLGPPTPAVAFSPASSRRPSTNEQLQPANRRPSINVTVSRRPSFGQPRPRVGSHGENRPPISFANLGRRLSDSLAMSALDTEDDHTDAAHVQPHRSRVNIGRGLSDSLSMSALSMSALDTDEEDAHHVDPTPVQRRSRANIGRGLSDTLSMSALDSDDDDERHIDSIHVQPRSRLSSVGDNRPIRPSPLHENSNAAPANNEKSSQPATGSVAAVPAHPQPPTSLASPAELAAQLHAHPKLANLRTSLAQGQPLISPISPPILVNSKCSGYFVEPMKWMESFLEGGQLAGKIICPNKKCGAKLGNYDWAGVCCGCKEWVTPGFCINRSKVDEVV